MLRQCLNGEWNYRIGKGEWGSISVPFSRLPVGHSECKRTFDLLKNGERSFLVFDGVTYKASIVLNGAALGEIGPYCEYRFDVTDIVRESENELTVELEDISPAFGPSMGWGNYGGIVRDVYLEFLADSYIEDVFFHCSLTDNYTAAEYVTELTLGGNGKGTARFVLSYNGKTVDEYFVEQGKAAPQRKLEKVNLWSPEEPNLYELKVELVDEGKVIDVYEHKVGFREFKTSRHRFVLNGKEVFLQGVCRHETVADYGHTVPYDVIEKELLAIKQAGCNYVRLVHYPHNKATLEILDRIGLMTSEEPGLWWSDTANKEISDGSLEVLRRTIKRDRNHACIVFWLCFNECRFTEQFLVDSARVCKECDPTRLVSGANCMSDDDTVIYYNRCGFDFYTQHPYSPSVNRVVEAAAILHDKPLMFTEWGGFDVYGNNALLARFIHKMYELYENNDDSGALAGASFWYWRECVDFNRGQPACVDGVLKESLLLWDGTPSTIYETFVSAWKDAKKSKNLSDIYEYGRLGLPVNKTPFTCDAATNTPELIKAVNAEMIYKMEYMRRRKATVGPVLLREEDGLYTVPKCVADGESICFCGDAVTDKITVIGAVSLLKGYPVSDGYGEDVARLTVEGDDGRTEEFVLRNGVEITTPFTTYSSSKINPIAEMVERFAEFSYDKNYENYLINRLDLSLVKKRRITKITVSSCNNGYLLLTYGIYA